MGRRRDVTTSVQTGNTSWNDRIERSVEPPTRYDDDGVSAITRFEGQWVWLSNFARVDIRYGGIAYKTVEHAYQAQKTMLAKERVAISQMYLASSARHAGRTVKLRKDWEEVKLEVMTEILELKYGVAEYRELLLATGERELVEGNNWHDRFYGMCDCGRRRPNQSYDPKPGCEQGGQNWLGRLTMAIREELR